MTSLTLKSSRQQPLRPLIEAALENELRLLEVGIRRTEERLRAFEEKYTLSSDEFLRLVEQDALPETMETIEWLGELRLLERLREKANTLREIQFAN